MTNLNLVNQALLNVMNEMNIENQNISIELIKENEDFAENTLVSKACEIYEAIKNDSYRPTDFVARLDECLLNKINEDTYRALSSSLDHNEGLSCFDITRKNSDSRFEICEEEGNWTSYNDALEIEKWWTREYDQDTVESEREEDHKRIEKSFNTFSADSFKQPFDARDFIELN